MGVRYRYAHTPTRPRLSWPHLAGALAAALLLGVGLFVLVRGVHLSGLPRPAVNNALSVPAALSPAAVQPKPAPDSWWTAYQSPTAWHVVAYVGDAGWVYFCDGDANGGTYWKRCSGSRCDDTFCTFPTEAAVDDFQNRLIETYHVEGAVVLPPTGWTPSPAPLGSRSGWNGKRVNP